MLGSVPGIWTRNQVREKLLSVLALALVDIEMAVIACSNFGITLEEVERLAGIRPPIVMRVEKLDELDKTRLLADRALIDR